jgi:hypothetical protein
MNLKKQNDVSLASLCATLAIAAIVVFSTALVQTLGAEEEAVVSLPMTPYEQCQIWNKWSDWPYVGQCPGDLQPRWYR